MLGFWLMAFMMLMGTLQWSDKRVFPGGFWGIQGKQVMGSIGPLCMEYQSVWRREILLLLFSKISFNSASYLL